MATRVFSGGVSVVLNSKGEIALKRDPEGRFGAADAAELHKVLLALAKKHKAQINKYCLFMAPGGSEPVLLANRYGNPYLAILTPRREAPDGTTAPKKGVVKLA